MRQLNDDYPPEHAVRVINRMVPASARSYVSVVAGVALSSLNGREPRMEIGYTVYVSIVRDDRPPFLDCGHVGPLNDTTSLMEFCRVLQQKIDAWTGRAQRREPGGAAAPRATYLPRPRP